MMKENMDNAINWLRASFYYGAVADALVGILMLIPSRMGETEFTFAMGLAASLMFGWTALLVWGSKAPMERRGVLLLTIIPVIAGIATSTAWAFAAGVFPLSRAIVWAFVLLSLIVLLGFSYLKDTRINCRQRLFDRSQDLPPREGHHGPRCPSPVRQGRHVCQRPWAPPRRGASRTWDGGAYSLDRGERRCLRGIYSN
jgi:hypothetical protein